MTNTENATADLNDFYSDMNLALFEDAAEHAEAVAADMIEPGSPLDADPAYEGLSIREIHEALDEHAREAASWGAPY